MTIHIACGQPTRYVDAEPGGCRVICTEHGVDEFHGSSHVSAVAAMRAHRALAHPA